MQHILQPVSIQRAAVHIMSARMLYIVIFGPTHNVESVNLIIFCPLVEVSNFLLFLQVNTYAAESISSLSQLVSLNMTNCHKAMIGPGAKLTGKGQPVKRPVKNGERHVSPVKLPTGLGSGKLANLRNLNLSCCVLLDDDAVIGLTKVLPKLQVCTDVIYVNGIYLSKYSALES